jgi:hypothetical protein
MTTDTPESVRKLIGQLEEAWFTFSVADEARDVVLNAAAKLIRYADSLERAARKQDGTHSTECWRWHHECAIKRIEAAQRALRGSE